MLRLYFFRSWDVMTLYAVGEEHPGRDHGEERHLRLHGSSHSYEPHHWLLHHNEPRCKDAGWFDYWMILMVTIVLLMVIHWAPPLLLGTSSLLWALRIYHHHHHITRIRWPCWTSWKSQGFFPLLKFSGKISFHMFGRCAFSSKVMIRSPSSWLCSPGSVPPLCNVRPRSETHLWDHACVGGFHGGLWGWSRCL